LYECLYVLSKDYPNVDIEVVKQQYNEGHKRHNGNINNPREYLKGIFTNLSPTPVFDEEEKTIRRKVTDEDPLTDEGWEDTRYGFKRKRVNDKTVVWHPLNKTHYTIKTIEEEEKLKWIAQQMRLIK
jgi:hypothetical protein